VRSGVEYKQFCVQPFEQKPGKWRAAVVRVDGKPVKILGGKKIEKFVTGLNATTAVAAMIMAMAVIDGGAFVRDPVATERIWRIRGYANGSRTRPDMGPLSRWARRRGSSSK